MASRALGTLAGLLIALAIPGAAAAGLGMEDGATVQGTALVLNGAGVRKRFVFDVYAIGLYLPRKVSDAAAALAAPGAKRVQIRMLRDVSAEQFSQALVDALRANHDEAQYRALEPRVRELVGAIAQFKEAKEGMRIALDWTGGETRVVADGKPAGQPIAGEDFYRALLRIWLGDKPVQDDLKLQLLGRT